MTLHHMTLHDITLHCSTYIHLIHRYYQISNANMRWRNKWNVMGNTVRNSMNGKPNSGHLREWTCIHDGEIKDWNHGYCNGI